MKWKSTNDKKDKNLSRSLLNDYFKKILSHTIIKIQMRILDIIELTLHYQQIGILLYEVIIEMKNLLLNYVIKWMT